MYLKILFLCLGNTERSQMAEGYYNYFATNGISFSAGLIKKPDHKRIPQRIINLMQEDEIDISLQKPKPISKKLISNCDQIYVLCDWHQLPNFISSLNKVIYEPVEDPYKMNLIKTREIRNEIKKIVKSII
ncbi:MAG: low molecular weight phosphatase family protein [Candidatus Moranbacteria bacterium]|nr:low molecular weight phosphatase family protein [Candidatus Moranbacteria bacterium]